MSTCAKEEDNTSNNKINSLEQCEVYHILDILRNSTVMNSNKAITNGQYKNKILSYFEEQMIDGQQIMLHIQNKKQFAEQISTYFNTKQIYAASMALMREFSKIDFNTLNLHYRQTSTPPLIIKQSITESIGSDYNDNCKTIQTCNIDEFQYILGHYILEHEDIKQDINIMENKQNILSYFRDNNINGIKALDMKRINFMNALSKHCDNSKLRGPSGKLYKLLHNNSSIEYPIVSLDNDWESAQSGEETKEENLEHQLEILDLESVDVNRIIYVIEHYIFKEIQQKIQQKLVKKQESNHSLTTIKTKIKEYFELNEINGLKLKNEQRTKFAQAIAVYVYDNSFIGLMCKLYTELVKCEWSKVDWDIITDNDDIKDMNDTDDMMDISPPSSIEECSMEQMVYLLSNYICSGPSRQKLKDLWDKHGNNITNYFEENDVDGSKLMEIKPKEFGKELSTFCNDNKLKPKMMKLYKEITKFKFDEEDILWNIPNNSIGNTSPEKSNDNIPNEETEEKYQVITVQKEINECNCIELIYVLNNYILKEDVMKKQYGTIKDNQSEIISYFKNNNLNGARLLNIDKKDFSKNIVDSIGNRKLLAPLRKLYSILTDTGNNTKYDIEVINSE